MQVDSLYEDNEYSRMLPDAKDKVSIGIGLYHQKRLVCTVKEFYVAFKLKYPCTKVGLSRFFEFKSKYGVLHLVPLEHIECVFVASNKEDCCWLMHVIYCAER